MSDGNKSFCYSYSGATNDELEQIKEKYTKKEVNEKMKRIRALDKRVDFLSTMISIFTGLFGSSILISGVILLIKDSNTVGVILTAFGILSASAIPFLHTKVYNSIKSHYAPEILSLIKDIEQNRI